MTIEEVLEVFKKSIRCILTDELICLNTECPKCALYVTKEQYNEAAQMAIEALEKQTPKKSKVDGSLAFCPSCGQVVSTIVGREHRLNYCWNCGQRIDWSV